MPSLLISPLVLILITIASVFLGSVALFYIRKFQLNIKVNIKTLENGKDVIAAMVLSIKDGIIMVDTDLNIVTGNKSAFELLGVEEAAGMTKIFMIIGEKLDLRLAVTSVIKNQTPLSLPEIEIGEKILQIDIEPVKDGGSLLLGAVIVFHDLTREKQLKKLREDFTAMMVHELRTPLTTIFYGVDGLLADSSRLTRELLEKNLQVIKSTTQEMLSLVNDLLDVSKVEAGEFEITKQPTNVKHLIEEKVSLFVSMVTQKNLQIITQINPNIGEVILDPNRIGQVLSNLISNAIKYTDSGTITVSAEKEGENVIISVTDSGDGLSSEDIGQLFSKFKQFGKGKSGQRGGTGLGLVVSKGIVETHGGKIWAESPGIGRGSTFSFSLPLS